MIGTTSTTITTTTTTTTETTMDKSPPSSSASKGPTSSTPPMTVKGEQVKTPFSAINEPFLQARVESDENNWSFHKGDISIEKFNGAISGFLTIFDALGSPIVTEIVRKDFRWKTNGLRNSARRLRVESLRDLVRKELESPPRFWAPSGIESLLWAHRILQFVDQLVDHMVEDTSMELKEACTRAYRATLAIRHPHMTKLVFEKALALVPARERFIANLSKHEVPTKEDFELSLLGMKDFLRATRPHIEALRTLFDMEEIEDPYR